MKTYIDENGVTKTLADELQERNEMLFSALEQDENALRALYFGSKGKQKMGGRMTMCILAELAKLPLMSRSDYVNMDADSLSAYYSAYMDFLRHYNLFEIPSSRQLLTAYMGLSVGKFLELMTDDSDQDRKEKAQVINDGFNALIFSQAEASNNNSSAIAFRGQVKQDGQGMVKQSDEITFNTLNVISPQENMARALDIAKSIKQMGGKK